MFYDNLKSVCEKQGLKITPIVAECGGAKGSISNWKNGAAPNSDIVLKLSVRLNVSTDFLLTGKEKSSSTELSADERELLTYFNKVDGKYKEKILARAEALAEVVAEQRQEKENKLNPKNRIVSIPSQCANESKSVPYFYMPVSAGTGVPLPDEDSERVLVEIPSCNADFIVRVCGDSMQPNFYDGDKVLVRAVPSINIGDIGIFIINGEGYIKKLGDDRLISLNKNYDDIIFSETDDIRCVGEVIGTINI